MGFTPQETQDFNVSDAEVDELMEKFGSESSGPSVLADEGESTSEVVDSPATTAQAPTPQQAAKAQAPADQQAQAQQQTQKEQEYEYQYKGRTIREPLSMILKRASQGYDYAQTVSELKRKEEAATSLESTYKPIDEWVRSNPEKWDKLQAVIKSEKEGYGDIDPSHPIIQKLSQFESVIQEIQQEKQAAKVRQEDEALDTEIKSIQDKYKDLDWVSVGDDGRNREQSVLAHAQEHGFRTFKAAFLDLYHDELLKGAESRAREQFAAQKEKQSKAGLLSSISKGAASSAPQPGSGLTQPKRNTKNYPSTDEILDELGIR